MGEGLFRGFLNININTLQDVLQVIASAYTEYDLKHLVERIQNLDSIDLEILYRITRYPNWDIEQIIELHESFRGEKKSALAAERRRKLLETKRGEFVKLGILKDVPNKCILAGDEFIYLYLRFWYEIRKFGDLSRRLELGKGPSTPFSEKIDKLVNSLSFELGRHPRMRLFTHYQFNIETSEIKSKLKKRFSILEKLRSGQKLSELNLERDEILEFLSESIRVCELVKESGPHHIVSVLVRNKTDVNQLIHVELYFDPVEIITLVSESTQKILKQQSEQANIWLEDIDDFKIAKIPNLYDFLKNMGATIEELFKAMDDVTRWRIQAIHRIVAPPELIQNDKLKVNESDMDEPDDNDEKEWLERYDSADAKGAIEILTEKIANCTNIKDNPKLARYYNDRGYIRSMGKAQQYEEAKKDLEKAIAFHFTHLELSLLRFSE